MRRIIDKTNRMMISWSYWITAALYYIMFDKCTNSEKYSKKHLLSNENEMMKLYFLSIFLYKYYKTEAFFGWTN